MFSSMITLLLLHCCQSAGIGTAGSNLHSVMEWIKLRQGFKTTGYIPTYQSGVTIGIGIDLGQQSESDLRGRGVPGSIITKVKPYLGHRSRAAVAKAGLKASSLKLSDAEATALSKPFILKNAEIAEEYGIKMSQNGRDVLASLRHWAGHLGNISVQGGGAKLAVRTPSGVTNFVWNAIENKSGTDAQLKTALKETAKYHTLGTAAYNRINVEKSHL